MKKSLLVIYLSVIFVPLSFSQSYTDNFESYTVNSYLGPQSSRWTTWSNADGTAEDAYVVNTKYASGSKSIYFYSARGGGPQDVVLPFGGQHNSGRFKFTANFFVPKGSAAYFNFQGGTTVGVSWPIEFYMRSGGNFNVASLNGTYPQDQWFEVIIDVDLTNNKWELFFDGVSKGSWKNTINSISYLNIYNAEAGEFWVDDVSYCLNNDCNPELSIETLSISPNPLCSDHGADVTVKIKNNGPMVAPQMNLAIDMAGQNRITKLVDLQKLGAGKDITITLPALFKSSIVASNVIVKAINMSKDPVSSNDTAKTTISILPSPSGSVVIKGSPFQGMFKAGNIVEPDLAEIGKTNTYELTPPKGYTNFNYNSAWVINSLIVKTSSGILVPSSAYSLTAPNTSTGANGTISYTSSKTYLDSTLIFSVSVQNKTNLCDSIVTRVVRVVPTPFTNFKFTSPVCDGLPVSFDNISTIHSGSLIFKWYFGDGDSNDVSDPIHVFPTSGTYCVKLVAISLPYNITHDTTICVTVTEIPKVDFKVFNACEGLDVSFTNQTTIKTGLVTYNWNFGDGTAQSTVTDPKHKYAKPGGYKVTLRASSNGCVATLSKNAIQFERPKAGFSVTGNCSKNIISFTNNTTIGAGDLFGDNWEFGDGNGDNSFSPTHIYSTAGPKTIKYLATSQFGCTDSMIKTIVISAAPEASFTNGATCNAKPVIFNNTTVEPAGVLTSYAWNLGDGGVSNNKNPQHNYVLGKHIVSLTATGNNGCSTMFEKEINVLLQPTAKFEANDACMGDNVIFTNNTIDDGVVNYKWKFGDGDSSTAYSPIKKYNVSVASTFNVTLIATTVGGCQDVITAPVNIKENPSCGFTFKSAGTGGFEYTFTPAVTSYPFYQWSFESGGISNSTIAKHKFNYDGTFRVRVFMKNADGCQCVDSSQFVTVSHLGVKSFDNSSAISYFPNPNNGSFNVKVSNISPTEIFTLNINDMAGKTLYTTNLLGNKNHEVSYNDLSNGIYSLEIVKQSGERYSSKMNILK